MTTTLHSFLHTLIYFFFIIITITNNNGDGVSAQSHDNLIEKTCKRFVRGDPNVKYGFCTTSLQAAPASQCATLRGLGSINLRLIRYNLTDTRCHIKQLLKDNDKGSKLDPYVRNCLSDCLEMYSDSISGIKQAMKSYNKKKFDDANVEISAVMDSAVTCEDGFKERNGVVSPLTKRNNDTFQLSAIALNLLNYIQTGSKY